MLSQSWEDSHGESRCTWRLIANAPCHIELYSSLVLALKSLRSDPQVRLPIQRCSAGPFKSIQAHTKLTRIEGVLRVGGTTERK